MTGSPVIIYWYELDRTCDSFRARRSYSQSNHKSSFNRSMLVVTGGSMTEITREASETKVSARSKLITSVVVGVVVGLVAWQLSKWQVGVLAAWDGMALIYTVWTWLVVSSMDGKATKAYALREDPSRATADSLMLFALLASLVGVGFMLAESSSADGVQLLLGTLFSVVSIALSWITLHTLFMLHYAEQYYRLPVGGVDFGTTKTPSYRDFSYLAFTVGMTFQVSDTQLSARNLRRTALKHALLSYVFGTVIIAATVNLVAGLGK